MVYSEVIANGWHKIVPQRKKYTIRDVVAVMVYSLANPVNGRTFNRSEASFIVKCMAVFFDAEYSKAVNIDPDIYPVV